MPLAGSGLASPTGITIEIQGKIDDIMAKTNRLDKQLDSITQNRVNADKRASLASASAAKTGTMAWTEFRSMYSTVLDVARVGQAVWAETGQKFVDYAEQVKNMSRSLGASAEETSRLIQVADDVRLSYDSLKMGMKMAQKDGIEPNIAGLAKLSDAYLSLPAGVQRTQFAIEKFGSKAGPEMEKLLVKGGNAIKAYAAGIDDALIMTEEGIKQADDYKTAVDTLNDTWDAFTYKVAPPLVKATTTIVESWTWAASILDKLGDGMPIEEATRLAYAEIDAAKAANQATDAISAEAGAMDELVDGTANAEAALKEMSDRNQELLNFTVKLGDFQKDYAEDHKKGVQDIEDAQLKLNEAVDKYGEKSKEALDARQEVEDARQSLGELEATWHETTDRMIYDMVLTKLSVDGLTDAEFDAAIQLGVTKGIFDQETADMAMDMLSVANATVEGIKRTEAMKGSVYNLSAAYANLAKNAAFLATADMRGRSAGVTRDSGGPGIAGTPYVINPVAAPEVFIPSSNGTFVPNADKKGLLGGGSTYNIVINNPKKETAENSIRKALKAGSYTGRFQ